MENNITISIDNFDDIFSDFDSREFTQRDVSDDFLNELKKKTIDIEFPLTEIRLELPVNEKKTEQEIIITKRLHQFFKIQLAKHERYLSKVQIRGFTFLILGMALLFLAGYSISLIERNWMKNAVMVITEPGGWYFAWNGLEKLFSKTEKQIPDLEFYKKINRAKIFFIAQKTNNS